MRESFNVIQHNLLVMREIVMLVKSWRLANCHLYKLETNTFLESRVSPRAGSLYWVLGKEIKKFQLNNKCCKNLLTQHWQRIYTLFQSEWSTVFIFLFSPKALWSISFHFMICEAIIEIKAFMKKHYLLFPSVYRAIDIVYTRILSIIFCFLLFLLFIEPLKSFLPRY